MKGNHGDTEGWPMASLTEITEERIVGIVFIFPFSVPSI
jgi:hypothetical protein